MKWSERLYFGTWQLGGQFKKMSSGYIESLLLFALNSGIRRFDTASVYGEGRVEKGLGICLPADTVIVTKIPAITKPDLKFPAPIQRFYSYDQINRSMDSSLSRLKRTFVDTVLLHNWLPSWSLDAVEILQYLTKMKDKGIVNRIGISLPDNFSTHLDQSILPYIDVIEAPFNPEQRGVLEQLTTLLGLKKEVLLRSLFCKGKLFAKYPAEMLAQDAFKLGTSVVIGMTTEEQIIQNISYLKGEKYGMSSQTQS